MHFKEAQKAYLEKIKDTELMKPENREAVEKAMKNMIDNGDFCMRIREGTLSTILDSDDRRFKTQIETGTSGGVYNPEFRKKATRTLFGADSSQVSDNAFENMVFSQEKINP